MSLDTIRAELRAKYGKDNKIKVLDEIGHVFVVDCMGGDVRIEEAARISYEDARPISDTRKLLRHLMRERHTSPFEQVAITLDIKLPIFVARQLVRYRTQKLNELSGRYSVLPEEFYTPPVDQVCYQTSSNKQGRSAKRFPLGEAEQLRGQMIGEANESFASYRQFIGAGMARETARIGLPLSTYTHWVTTWDLHNLLHMLEQRLDPHAQWEIRQYAEAIWRIVQDWCPLAAEAFVDYRLEAKTFSRKEVEALRRMVKGYARDEQLEAESRGISGTTEGDHVLLLLEDVGGLTNREQDDFFSKLGLR
jgi:thymidylate synthase (FAD)